MKKFLFILAIGNLILFNFAYGLTIAPAKIEFDANPGDEIKFSIYTRNDGDLGEYAYSIVKGFSEDGGGGKIFIEDAPEISWVQIPEKVAVPLNQMIEVPVVIKVPENAPSGGHFLAVGFGSFPKVQESKVGVGVNVLGLVYINVSGNRFDKISISELLFKNFYFSLPVNFSYKIKNDGNTYVRPVGDIEIRNVFGKLVANLKINERELQILPNIEKTMENSWKTNFAFGPYKATFNILYGPNKDLTLKQDHWFFVLPLNILAVLIFILILIIWIIPWLIRKYNKWVISRANKQ